MTDLPETFVPSDFTGPYLENVGPFYISDNGDGDAIGLRVLAAHTNYVGIVHGGMLTTLADVALSFHLRKRIEPAPIVTTISLVTNFLSTARLGDWLLAESVVDRIGNRVGYVHGSIQSGDKMIATMSGVFNIVRKE
jgi:acyl-coenzyme A thioesterase 13